MDGCIDGWVYRWVHVCTGYWYQYRKVDSKYTIDILYYIVSGTSMYVCTCMYR